MTKSIITVTLFILTALGSWGWVDEDWVGDVETHHSHTGFALMMNGGDISWKSGLEDFVVLSTLESE